MMWTIGLIIGAEEDSSYLTDYNLFYELTTYEIAFWPFNFEKSVV